MSPARRSLLAALLLAVSLPVGAAARTDSEAARKVAVPNVVGRQKEVAQRRLRRVGLISRVVSVDSLKLVGIVVAQKPRAGVRVVRRTRVSIFVSRGPGP